MSTRFKTWLPKSSASIFPPDGYEHMRCRHGSIFADLCKTCLQEMHYEVHALLHGTKCEDCGVESTLKSILLVVKSDHHGGFKRVCEERAACHGRS